MNVHRLGCNRKRWLGASLLAGFALCGWGQTGELPEEPRWLSLRLADAYLATEVESEMEERTLPNEKRPLTRERLLVAPTVGLGVRGSVYHPNLLDFSLSSEAGPAWQDVSITVPALSLEGARSSWGLLQRYQGSVSVLKEKPYATTFFANRSDTFREYDFFSRAKVFTQTYGGRVGYATGPVPVSLSATHTEEDVTGLLRPTRREDTTLVFDAHHERSAERQTDFSYSVNQFLQEEVGSYRQEGLNHSIQLFDTEAFGKTNRCKLNSSLLYNELDTDLTPASSLTMRENLTVEHSKTFQSRYEYGFNRSTSGSAENVGHEGRAGVQHQLFESLTSGLELRGSTTEATAPESRLSATRFGAAWTESYAKKLGSWGKLTFGGLVSVGWEERSSQGQVIFVIDEAHTLKDGVVTFLNQPRVVLSSLHVTDSTGTVLYGELLDYRVWTEGPRVELRRVPGGRIPDGGTVFVDYQAVGQPADAFTTFTDQCHVRLELWKGLLALYGRVNFVENSGGRSLVLEEVTATTGGAELAWGPLHTAVEYQLYDSNLAPYETVRVSQNLTWDLAEGLTFTLDGGASWTEFVQANRQQRDSHAIGRWRARLTSALSVDAEGGVRVTEGAGVDQTLATARFGLEFAMNKLAVRLSYDFQDQDYLGELRNRHFLSFRMKRIF